MKLIFIKKNFSVHGGAENYMKTLIGSLKGSADVHVMAKSWAETEGITFHKINSLSLGSFISLLSFNSNVCRELKNISADCAVSFERTTCQDIYRAGEGCHREWLRLRDMIEPFWKRYTFMINPLHIALLRIEKQLFSDTKIIIANSNMVKSQIMRHYKVPEERIRIIYNGVDLKRFSPENAGMHRAKIRQGLSISEGTKLILFVGSGFERKGLAALIKSVSLLDENAMLLVIGKGNIKKFSSIAKKYGINDKVLFLGPQKEIERFYASADIFALPTIYDPFSNATLEAMASGLPVITTKNNGVSELIKDGEEGFAVEDPLDHNILSEKIELALADCKAMGLKARLRAEKFPIEKAAEEFLKIIQTTPAPP